MHIVGQTRSSRCPHRVTVLCLRTVKDVYLLPSGLWASSLSCVSPEVGLVGLVSNRPPLLGKPCPTGPGAVVTPRVVGTCFHSHLNTQLASSKGRDFFQSDPHGSVDFGRERWFSRGAGHLEPGQVISGTPVELML